MTALSTLSRLLLDLHGPIADAPRAAFRECVLARLAEAFSFGSAVWASGAMTPRGPDFHTVTLWRQPPQLLIDYESLKHLDPLFVESARNPGRPVRATARTSLPPPFIPFIERYGLEQAMSTMFLDPRSQLLTGVSVWRPGRHEPFTADDAAMMEAAFPHLMEAASRRALRDIVPGRPFEALTACRAAVDPKGRLHCADAGFVERLAAEFPQWRGPDLPEPLLAVLRAGGEGECPLGTVVAGIVPCGELFAVYLRSRSAVDILTRRQREIVELSARGLTHKEIAQRVGLSPTTVRNHIAHAHRRLGVRNRAELTSLLRGPK